MTSTSFDRKTLVARRLQSARDYTRSLLEDLQDEEWFWQPTPAVTHVAWQVGHLAMAEYGLLLFRQRGRQPIDTELMSGQFRKRFAKGTQPSSSPEDYPSPEEILAVLDRVHAQALQELPTFDEASLDEAVDPPYAAFATKFGAMLFAADHEMLHAGQIGLVRRLMGKSPLR